MFPWEWFIIQKSSTVHSYCKWQTIKETGSSSRNSLIKLKQGIMLKKSGRIHKIESNQHHQTQGLQGKNQLAHQGGWSVCIYFQTIRKNTKTPKQNWKYYKTILWLLCCVVKKGCKHPSSLWHWQDVKPRHTILTAQTRIQTAHNTICHFKVNVLYVFYCLCKNL